MKRDRYEIRTEHYVLVRSVGRKCWKLLSVTDWTLSADAFRLLLNREVEWLLQTEKHSQRKNWDEREGKEKRSDGPSLDRERDEESGREQRASETVCRLWEVVGTASARPLSHSSMLFHCAMPLSAGGGRTVQVSQPSLLASSVSTEYPFNNWSTAKSQTQIILLAKRLSHSPISGSRGDTEGDKLHIFLPWPPKGRMSNGEHLFLPIPWRSPTITQSQFISW